MSEGSARRWLVISAMVTFGVWVYRKWQEGPTAVLDTPKFITAWGTVYLSLSIVTEAYPAFGGAFSLLVMTGDLLGNALPPKGSKTGGLIQDLSGQQAGQPAKGSPSLLSGSNGAQTSPPGSTGGSKTPVVGRVPPGKVAGGATPPSSGNIGPVH